MGIYGHTWDNYRVDKEVNENLVIEIYADHENYQSIKEHVNLLLENMTATVSLNNNGKQKVDIVIRDRVTVQRGGSSKHVESPSVKVTGPAKLVGKSGYIDILIPSFTKTGEKPYPGAKTPGEVNGEPVIDKNNKVYGKKKIEELPADLRLAVQFVKEYQKELNLIYTHNENERNQYQLFEKILKSCDYISSFTCSDNKQQEKLRNKYTKE